MNLHEYQAKELLAKYGIKTQRGEVTDNPETAAEIFRRLTERQPRQERDKLRPDPIGNISEAVVKAQIHSGGRGKAGGIKFVNTPEQAQKATAELIGKTLITRQTGPAGKVVHKVLIAEALTVERELYLGIVIDRRRSLPVLMASAEGGMEIEELSRKSPEKIIKVNWFPGNGFPLNEAKKVTGALNLERYQKEAVELIRNFTRLFVENDCSLAEINPLIVNKTYGLVALDAKINLDDRGLYRHKDLSQWRDIAEEHPLEYEASKYDLSYIGLDGNIGCMVNGAGLAMSTMDLIKLAGGEPANFLDVGGGATTEQVAQAFKILVSNKNVRAILVNIFGGIMKCDVIAQGITTAVKEVGLTLPMVVRLEGTNVELGKKILKESGLNIISADTMDEAAESVVRLVSGV